MTSVRSQRDGVVAEGAIHCAEVHVSCGVLYDLVILAAGASAKLAPLCNETAKPMMMIGNKPLIWYVVKPWADKGARTVFICTHDYALTAMSLLLETEFPMITFRFVTVPAFHKSGSGGSSDDTSSTHSDNDSSSFGIPSTSCDAVTAYFNAKKILRVEGAPEGQPRDALLVSGDTILAKLDVEPFVSNFYASMASAAVLLWRPVEKKPAATEPSGKSSGKAKSAVSDGLKPYINEFSCVAYEEKEDAAMAWMTTSGSSSAALLGGAPPVQHRRLHFLRSMEHDPQPNVSVGFAARRPNLTFCADVVDAHVYLLRSWVVEYVATLAASNPTIDDVPTLKKDILPLLARSQHALLNKETGTYLTPIQRLQAEKIHSARNVDWALDTRTTRSIGCLNSVHSATPHECVDADALRVVCSIYTEASAMEAHPQCVRRVNSKENYLHIHHEVVSALPNSQKDFTPNTMAWTVLDTSADEHDQCLHQNPAASSRVVQSLIRSVPQSDAFITRSVVGQRVVLGKHCRITNSVVADNVELQDNSVVTNSVVSAGTVVHAGVRVVNCFVAPQELITSDETDTIVVSRSEFD